MKDYLKNYLAGREGKELPPHSREGEVPEVPKAALGSLTGASGTCGTCQRVEYPENLQARSDVVPVTSPISEPEIQWRVEVMLSQIPDKGPLPFLVAREAVEPQAGCCLSCGDPLNSGEAYRCAHCSRAANVAVEMAMFISKSGAENGGRVD